MKTDSPAERRAPHRSLHSETGALPGEHPGRSEDPLIKVADGPPEADLPHRPHQLSVTMPDTKLLAKGNPIQVDPAQSELAQLDVSSYGSVRLSVGNKADSPGPVVITIAQVDQPNTPDANFIAGVDAFTLAPDEWASKVYEIPGEVVAFVAGPEQPPLGGIQVFFTIYGRTG
jgi:hypothetical protein